MEKLISKSIKLKGNILIITKSYKGNPGIATERLFITLEEDEELLPLFKEVVNSLMEDEDTPEKEEEISYDLPYYLDQVRKEYNVEKLPISSVLSIVLKKIAIAFDARYPDHISKSPHIYAISTTNGDIIEIYKKSIASYKGFAAIRTIKDAVKARIIVKELLDAIFNNG